MNKINNSPADASAYNQPNTLTELPAGTVWLTGAGCGDPELITMRAVRALEEADCIVYDALANPALLDLASPKAERIYVGKRAAQHALPQDKINELLVTLAKSGKNVTRLKGGDPYVFGRGGEEGEYLYAQGVDFEVIPGIPSAIGGLAYAGIPVTHRDSSQSFTVVTGHLKEGASDLDWPALAALPGTIVFLMGVKNLPSIAASLIAHGKDKRIPAAIVHKASTPDQRTVTGTLETLPALAAQTGITAPSIIVVGEVVNKRDALNFFETKPLFGKTIVVTRARAQASALSKKLRALGANVAEYPAIKIQAIEDELARAVQALSIVSHGYTDLVLTSVNGVELFFEALLNAGLDARALHGLRVTAIGSATADALHKYGVLADVVPSAYVAEALADSLIPLLTDKSKVLLARAAQARPYLSETLRKICTVDEYKLYDTVPDEAADDTVVQNLIDCGRLDAVTFTSSSTAKNFAAAFPADSIHNAKMISIGPQTTASLESLGFTVAAQADVYTIDGLVAALTQTMSSTDSL